MRIVLTVLLSVIIFFSPGAYLFSQDIDPFNYRDVRLSALGGVTVFGAEGASALFTNPASINRSSDVDYTLFQATPWLTSGFKNLNSLTSTPSDSEILDASKSGYGEGFALAAGITGKGVGIGLLNGLETFNYDDDSSTRGEISADLSAVIGYAVGITPGDWDICIAGDIRPLARVYGTYDQATALEAGGSLTAPLKLYETLSRVENPWYATGFAFDLGATVALRGLSIGALIRDVGNTRLTGSTSATVADAVSLLYAAGAQNSGDGDPVNLTIPMKVNAGLQYIFNYENADAWQPALFLEVQDLLNTETLGELPKQGIIGFDMGIPGPLSLLGAISSEGVSLGADLDLPILGLGISWFSELPETEGGEGMSGIALEARLRF